MYPKDKKKRLINLKALKLGLLMCSIFMPNVIYGANPIDILPGSIRVNGSFFGKIVGQADEVLITNVIRNGDPLWTLPNDFQAKLRKKVTSDITNGVSVLAVFTGQILQAGNHVPCQFTRKFETVDYKWEHSDAHLSPPASDSRVKLSVKIPYENNIFEEFEKIYEERVEHERRSEPRNQRSTRVKLEETGANHTQPYLNKIEAFWEEITKYYNPFTEQENDHKEPSPGRYLADAEVIAVEIIPNHERGNIASVNGQYEESPDLVNLASNFKKRKCVYVKGNQVFLVQFHEKTLHLINSNIEVNARVATYKPNYALTLLNPEVVRDKKPGIYEMQSINLVNELQFITFEDIYTAGEAFTASCAKDALPFTYSTEITQSNYKTLYKDIYKDIHDKDVYGSVFIKELQVQFANYNLARTAATTQINALTNLVSLKSFKFLGAGQIALSAIDELLKSNIPSITRDITIAGSQQDEIVALASPHYFYEGFNKLFINARKITYVQTGEHKEFVSGMIEKKDVMKETRQNTGHSFDGRPIFVRNDTDRQTQNYIGEYVFEHLGPGVELNPNEYIYSNDGCNLFNSLKQHRLVLAQAEDESKKLILTVFILTSDQKMELILREGIDMIERKEGNDTTVTGLSEGLYQYEAILKNTETELGKWKKIDIDA